MQALQRTPGCPLPHLGVGGRWWGQKLGRPSFLQEAGQSWPAHCTVFPGLLLCLVVTASAGRSWGKGREEDGGGAEAAHSGYQGDAAEQPCSPARPPDPRLSVDPRPHAKQASGGEGERGTDYLGLGLRAAPLFPSPKWTRWQRGRGRGQDNSKNWPSPLQRPVYTHPQPAAPTVP